MLPSALRWQLALPPLLPAAVFMATIAAFQGDTLTDRYYSIGTYVLFYVLLPIAVAFEAVALRRALPILIAHPAARTVASILCAAIGIAFLALSIVAVFWFM